MHKKRILEIKINNLLFIIVCINTAICAREEGKNHVWEGNLALPTSQQPSPLFAFGQNIVDKGDLQLFGDISFLQGTQKKSTEVIPGILYGVTNNLSLFFNIPVAARFELNQNASSGIEDIWLQAEYAYYNRDEERYALQATLVGIIYLPTGSIKKNPSTRINAPSFLIETTLSYTGVDWYAFVSPGVFFPMSSQKKQTANKLLYQAGLGRNIGYSSKKWLLTPLIELYGAFSKKTSSNNSPGIYLHLGPNAWFATERLIIQAGVVFTVFQKKTTCCSNKNNYWAAINIGWKFN